MSDSLPRSDKESMRGWCVRVCVHGCVCVTPGLVNMISEEVKVA